jgi:hypothetical protein
LSFRATNDRPVGLSFSGNTDFFNITQYLRALGLS